MKYSHQAEAHPPWLRTPLLQLLLMDVGVRVISRAGERILRLTGNTWRWLTQIGELGVILGVGGKFRKKRKEGEEKEPRAAAN